MSGGRSRGTWSAGRDARELSEEPPPPWGPAGRGAAPPGGVGAGSGPGPRHQGRPAAGAVPEVHAGARPAPPDFHLREQEHGRGLLPAAGEGGAPAPQAPRGAERFPGCTRGGSLVRRLPRTLIQVPWGLSPLCGLRRGLRQRGGACEEPLSFSWPCGRTVSGTVCRFPHGPETLSFKCSGFPLLHQPPTMVAAPRLPRQSQHSARRHLCVAWPQTQPLPMELG